MSPITESRKPTPRQRGKAQIEGKQSLKILWTANTNLFSNASLSPLTASLPVQTGLTTQEQGPATPAISTVEVQPPHGASRHRETAKFTSSLPTTSSPPIATKINEMERSQTITDFFRTKPKANTPTDLKPDNSEGPLAAKTPDSIISNSS
jgi:hypothetical protein